MFWLTFLRLVLSVGVEAASNFFSLFVFLARRRHIRARVIELMRGAPSRAVLVAVLFAGLVGPGCRTTYPGSSFQRQVDELGWSARVLVEMPEWKDSLVSDVEVLLDPEWDELPDTLAALGW